MALIECKNVRKDFAGRELFADLSFSIEEGRKVALIGPNGSGKTSLLRILAGLDDDYSGRVDRAPGLRLGYVPQRFEPEPGVLVSDVLLEDVHALRTRLLEAEAEMSDPGAAEGVLERYGALRNRYDSLGGDEAEDHAQRLLIRAGLGGCADRPASALSGGEANVLGLLKALMAKPMLLMLDEPGNHLDLWGQAWLEDFLKGMPTALLLVSHNRWLIDREAERTLSLEGGRLYSFAGGYSAYRLERLRKAAADGAGWQADRKKIERLEEMVERIARIAASRPDPAWGKRLRARRSQLEREKSQARERPDAGRERMDPRFAPSDARSTYALRVEGYRKAFGDRTLFEDARFDALCGEKIAVVGRNGCGKTTFIRDLVANGDWNGDVLRIAPSMRVGYVSQAQDLFPGERILGDVFGDLGAKAEEARKLLRRFLFRAEDLGRRIGELSGGELNRLQIARAVWLKANFLILDEPTNHLDIVAREAVEDALCEFDGTVLLVSHDRFLIEAVADRIVFAENGTFETYEGTFSEFWRDAGRAACSGVRAAKGIEGRAAAVTARPAGAARKADAGGDIADRIEALEREREGLEKEAEKAVREGKFAAGRRLASEIDKLKRRIEKLYAEYCA